MAIPEAGYELAEIPRPSSDRAARPGLRRWPSLAWPSIVALCVLHAWAIWAGLGGRDGIAGEWPPLFADHGIHYHHGLVARHSLAGTGTTAGYDPSFMSGYA